jgi:hypothetical protein
LGLCPQPSLTERTVDDHRQLPARYGAMGSALRGRLATVLLHHVGGHDRTITNHQPALAADLAPGEGSAKRITPWSSRTCSMRA